MNKDKLVIVISITMFLTVCIVCIGLAFGGDCPPTETPMVMSDYVMDLWAWGNPHIQPGQWFYAVADDGNHYGLWQVSTPGTFLLHTYGNRPDTPEDEGFETGEQVRLYLKDSLHCAHIRTRQDPIPWTKWAGGQIQPCNPGDINCDGVINPLDYEALRDIAFRNAGPAQDWHNLNRDATAADIVDVALLVNVIFRGGDPGTLKW